MPSIVPVLPPPSDYCPLPNLPTQHLGADHPPGTRTSEYSASRPSDRLCRHPGPGGADSGQDRSAGPVSCSCYRTSRARLRATRASSESTVHGVPEHYDLVVQQTHPRVALPPLVNAILTTGDNVLSATAPGVSAVGVETLMVTPTFPQPMYEPLRDLSQDYLLPGREGRTRHGAGSANQSSFCRVVHVGLNHEMGRELLWRGYPTDQRGTYFDHFWGLGVPNVASRILPT